MFIKLLCDFVIFKVNKCDIESKKRKKDIEYLILVLVFFVIFYVNR